MSERSGSTHLDTGTAEIPVVRPAGATVPVGDDPAAVPPVPGAPSTPDGEPSTQALGEAPPQDEPVPGIHPAAPGRGRRSPRLPRPGPLTVMGPWAPVAGGLLGLLLGVVVVLFLAGSAEAFEERLALAFTVLGLGMLGTAGILLGDEVRMLRQQSREAAVRPAWVEATAGLLNGLTPARLLLLVSGFVLFLAAYVSRG
jgi:hypothetical protein